MISVPCGRCIGCRLERSRQWAMRIVHEASLHEENCFVTLTYDDDHLPIDYSLDVTVFQKFMKRLRKLLHGTRIRFYHCGEYGDERGRPHYHVCVFGTSFADRYHWTGKGDSKLYRSPTLEQAWPFGHCLIGELTFESAAYVARYVVKKVTGQKALAHYQDRAPEYATMSRRPGIGHDWYARYGYSVQDHDSVVIRGRLVRPPKYYDGLMEKVAPDVLAAHKLARVERAREAAEDMWQRRLDKWMHHRLRIAKMKRLTE